MTSPTVGLAIIARDEADNLPRLLASIEGAFNRVVLLDTGSTDDTTKVFLTWAGQQAGMTYSVDSFDWVDDFAAARNAADRLLMWGTQNPSETTLSGKPFVEWTCWADCDDTIVGAQGLRNIVAQVGPQVAALIFDYDYARHPHTGECICTLRRERLVRAGAGHWVGRVHEAQIVNGGQTLVPVEHGYWQHHKQAVPEAAGSSNARNLRILRRWVKDEPENPRVLAYVGTELALSGDPARVRRAVGYFKRYLKLKSAWDDERAQVCRKLAVALILMERFDEAERYALQALVLSPAWPDSYLTLGEVALAREQPQKALIHARRALEVGPPSGSMLILNPLDYTVHPYRLIAGAHGQLEQWDEAVDACDRVLAHEPADQGIQGARADFADKARREHTAQTYVIAAQQLVASDEQLKALTLLEDCVPYFATDHPAIVAARSELRQRLVWLRRADGYVDHYQTGGSKPEDFHGDEMIEPVGQSLPRVGFLLHGLAQQIAEAA